jgi:hypothetical protein
VNAFNRLIMLVVALLLIAVPVLLFLIGFRILPAEQVNAYLPYQGALDALDTLVAFSFDAGARTLTAITGTLVALFLLLREIPLGKRVARKTLIQEAPGREIAITAGAVRQLAEAAAREAGADSPSCSLASDKNRRYDVACNIQVPRSQNFTELAARVRDNIQRMLEEQQVPVKGVEVTVQGTASRQE